jgi:hypothetical protein
MLATRVFATLVMVPLLGLGTAAGAEAAAPASPPACPSTMIFEVGGHLDPDATVYDASNAQLPAGVAFTKIVYPAQIAPYPGDTLSMDTSVADGIATLSADLTGFHASCPNAHVTISGYSEGAIVAGNELGTLSGTDAIPHSLINGVLYGDPRRPGNPAVDDGYGGIETNLPTIIPGITMQGPRGFGDLTVHEICNSNDGICLSANPINNLVCFANGVDGYFSGDHSYDIDPYNDGGNGDTVNQQPLRIAGCGAPLPVVVPTPYQLFNGNLAEAQNSVATIRQNLIPLLPASIAGELNLFPWL